MSLRDTLYRPAHIALDAVNRFRRSSGLKKKLHSYMLPSDTMDAQYRREILAYWGKYVRVSTDWHAWFTSRSGIRDVRFVPENVFHNYIAPYYCRLEYSQAYTDKAMYSLLLPNVKQPVMVAKNQSGVCYDDSFHPITLEDVVSRCLLRDQIIIKPAIDSGGGRRIRIFDRAKLPDYEREVRAALTEMEKDYVIQEVVKQHADLSRIYPDSVNTVRTISFYFEGEVHILLSVLRMGTNGSQIDNFNTGGIAAGLYPDGRLKPEAFDMKGKSVTVHPQGFTLAEGFVPNYQKIVDTIVAEHPRFGHYRIISWDFAVDQEGDPVLIEYNLNWQGVNFQICSGPLFGDLTDRVLDEVFCSGGKRGEL